jgi:hypothetical protein
LNAEQIRAPLQQAAQTIEATLSTDPTQALNGLADAYASPGAVELPDPLEGDLSPWLLRRLHLAEGIAQHLRSDAGQVLRPADP